MHRCPRQAEGCSHSSRSGNTQGDSPGVFPPPVRGRLGAREELLRLQQGLPWRPMPGLSSVPPSVLAPPLP